MKRILVFFNEIAGELKKVVWPTRDEVIASTKVVVVSLVIISVLLGALDFLLLLGIDFIF